MLTVKHEEISPSAAHLYLAKSGGNRHINAEYVLALAVAMETGRWDADASEIVFDEDGVLIDGHHRLNAVVAFEKPVRMLVKRGVSKSARSVIDTGRTRTMAHLMEMFRPDEQTYGNNRRAALTTCVSLMVSKPPRLRTLNDYDSWMKHFEVGIEAIVRILAGGNTNALRRGPVLGALAFAHRTSPAQVEDFARRLEEGSGLAKDDPALTLRNVLIGSKANGGSGDRLHLAKKVLSGVQAHLRKEKWAKAQVSANAHAFFRKAYDAKAIERLVKLWTPEGVSNDVEEVQS